MPLHLLEVQAYKPDLSLRAETKDQPSKTTGGVAEASSSRFCGLFNCFSKKAEKNKPKVELGRLNPPSSRL